MQISQMFKRKPCVFSIECFPPKQTANFDKMKDTLRTMRTLNPDFISVTYGAGAVSYTHLTLPTIRSV